MPQMQRRSFLELSLFALPATSLMAQADSSSTRKAALVLAGTDREGKTHAVGISSTSYKVLTAETSGAMFAMQQLNHKQGGPARHLHHGQDELFYVIEGEYIVEVGADQFRLKAGDCVLGPRGLPHAWAFVGDTAGKLLLTYTPAGKMEAFFNEREHLGIKPGAYASSASDAEMMRAFGMELTGPPLKIS